MLAAGLISHANVTTDIPNSYKQGISGSKVAFWQKGIDKEPASQHKTTLGHLFQGLKQTMY